MPKCPLPDSSVVLIFLRTGLGWTQTELADACGIQKSLISGYESGGKPLSRQRLEQLVFAMGLGREEIDRALACLEAIRAGAGKRRPADGALSPTARGVEEVAVKAGRLVESLSRQVLSLLTVEGQRLQDRQDAEALWRRLKRESHEDRLMLIEDAPRFRTWALVERMAAESITMAPKSPSDALKLAELAVRAAELLPGEQWLRQQAQGYAWFHVANARKVATDFEASDAALAKAKALWKAGATEESASFFSAATVLALEAKVHQARRRFDLALRRIEEALAADTGELRGRLLLNKAQILDALGNPLSSSEVLREASTYLDEQGDPRTALGVQYQLLMNLCLADRAAEAAPGLPHVRALAERLGEELNLIRVVWLSGIVAAGCNRLDEAEAAFEQARGALASFDPPIVFDYALVSLELAVILLRQNRFPEVIAVAERIVLLADAHGFMPEAHAALKLYCEAARRKAATVELTRRVIRFLHRAQHDPCLRYDATVRAEASS